MSLVGEPFRNDWNYSSPKTTPRQEQPKTEQPAEPQETFRRSSEPFGNDWNYKQTPQAPAKKKEAPPQPEQQEYDYGYDSREPFRHSGNI